jgi:hypothetical protein
MNGLGYMNILIRTDLESKEFLNWIITEISCTYSSHKISRNDDDYDDDDDEGNFNANETTCKYGTNNRSRYSPLSW